MPFYCSQAPPAPLSLPERLDRLRSTLDDVGLQLAEGIASAIASTVAGAVRDAVTALLIRSRNQRIRDQREPDDHHWHSQSSSWWDEPEEANPTRWSGPQE